MAYHGYHDPDPDASPRAKLAAVIVSFVEEHGADPTHVLVSEEDRPHLGDVAIPLVPAWYVPPGTFYVGDHEPPTVG